MTYVDIWVALFSRRVVEKEKVKLRKQSGVEGQAAVDLSLLKAVDGLRFMERLIGTNVFDDVLEGKQAPSELCFRFEYFEIGSPT